MPVRNQFKCDCAFISSTPNPIYPPWMLIFVRIVIDLVGQLIQLVPSEGNVVLNVGCRSVSDSKHITIVEWSFRILIIALHSLFLFSANCSKNKQRIFSLTRSMAVWMAVSVSRYVGPPLLSRLKYFMDNHNFC